MQKLKLRIKGILLDTLFVSDGECEVGSYEVDGIEKATNKIVSLIRRDYKDRQKNGYIEGGT